MAILIHLNQTDPLPLEKHLKALPDCPEIRIWPHIGDADDIDCIIVWKHTAGVLNQFPNLKLIASHGAGVENILADPDLPVGVPITRFVDDSLSEQMAEFVLAGILNQRLHLTYYRELQAANVWRPQPYIKGKTVTILGMGELGTCTAKHLRNNGYIINGWSRTEKHIKGVKSYYGDDQLLNSVAAADFIVCLLPLTAATTGILSHKLFCAAKIGAYLINVGRGHHLNEDDLMAALYETKLSGALLDVFKEEPLDKDHPFWRHPKIHLTPHISSPTDKALVAAQILDNYKRLKNGESLIYQIDPKREY